MSEEFNQESFSDIIQAEITSEVWGMSKGDVTGDEALRQKQKNVRTNQIYSTLFMMKCHHNQSISMTLGRLRTPVRHTFSYGIRHIFIVIH